jgi:hypothetical protein
MFGFLDLLSKNLLIKGFFFILDFWDKLGLINLTDKRGIPEPLFPYY